MNRKILVFLAGIFVTLSSCATSVELYNVGSKQSFPLNKGVELLPTEGFIILGETHYDLETQQVQGQFIEAMVSHLQLENNFSVAWEFLNFPDQKILEEKFKLYSEGTLNFTNFLQNFFGQNPGGHLLYEPIFKATSKYSGKFVATNAPREWKSKIVASGLSGLDSQYIPQNMERGSPAYFERFLSVMGNHAPQNKIENYFLAQSYSDAVMAKSLVDLSEGQLKFMIVGNFHSDFGHGLPTYLEKVTNENVLQIRMVNLKGLTHEERIEALSDDPKYGPRSSWLLILNR